MGTHNPECFSRQEQSQGAVDVYTTLMWISLRPQSLGSSLNIPRHERFFGSFQENSVRSFMILKDWKRNVIRGYPERMTSEDAVNILKHSSHQHLV